ncbi:MAG: riboflavin synthase, partial [Alphaproteobacteria bacterium]|nr:riboflavin synthase [Alphaproteobacteria bacterium]
MFTGIITDIGCVKKITQGGDVRFDITTTYETAGINIGASIACSGVCLTVIEKGADWFAVEASQETLSLSTAGAWQANTPLNLERALTTGDELGGHIVSGHVDGVAKIEAIDNVGDSKRFTFCAPPNLMRFVA